VILSNIVYFFIDCFGEHISAITSFYLYRLLKQGIRKSERSHCSNK